MDYIMRYKALKDKYKDVARYIDFRHNAIKKFSNRFVWSGHEEFTPPISKNAWIEKILLKNGLIGFGEINGRLAFMRGDIGGDLDETFGVPTKFIGFTNAGLSKEFTIGVDCTVCFNDCSAFPSMFTIDRYSQMLADVDLSIECLTRYARCQPIPQVPAPEYEKVKKILDDIYDGKTKIISSEMMEEIKNLDLLKPEQIQNMECLSRLHDELTRRLALEFGIDIETKDKKAQIQTAELEAFSTYTAFSVVPDYYERKDFCKWTNSLFGTNLDVKMASMFDDLENGKNQETTDKVEDTKEGEEDEIEKDIDEETDNNN